MPGRPHVVHGLHARHAYHGKRFRTLNVIDEGVREILANRGGYFAPSRTVIRLLDQLKESQPLPEQIRVDIGPELISAKLVAWCEKHQIQLHHIQPGKPTQNASIERFNRTLLVHVWLIDYNEERPHDFSQKPPARTLPQEPNNPKTSPNLNFRNAIPGPGGDERWLG